MVQDNPDFHLTPPPPLGFCAKPIAERWQRKRSSRMPEARERVAVRGAPLDAC